jgi:5-formaminoimidazole-4-carboxamide-1-(beta)-D-ribofuranosyl 5'-monophosphate synthetase
MQTVVDRDMGFYICDIVPFAGEGTSANTWVGHPYGNMLWRRNMSTGRRTAMELRRAVETDRLDEIVT